MKRVPGRAAGSRPGRPDEETERSEEPWHDDEPRRSVNRWRTRPCRAEFSRAESEERHPLLQQAMDLLVRFDTLFRDADPRFAPALGTLYHAAGDAMGGLAQALSHRDDDAVDHGLRVVQLKRALRGAAFARGALFPLRSTMSEEQFDELFRMLQQMETDIVSELGKVRFD